MERPLNIPSVILMAILSSGASAILAQNTFSKYLGRNMPGSIELDHLSNQILLCHTTRYGVFDGIDGFVYHKLDSAGNYVQTREFTTGPLVNIMQHGEFAKLHTDGDVSLIFGNHQWENLPESMRLFHLNSDAEVLWNRKIWHQSLNLGLAYLRSQNIHITDSNGLYIMATQTEQVGGSSFVARAPEIIYINGGGEIIWNRSFDLGTDHGWLGCSSLLPNGDMLVGFSASAIWNLGAQTPYVCQLGENGVILWSKRIEGCEATLTGYASKSDGHLLFGKDSTGIVCLSINNTGDVVWANKIEFNDSSIFQVPSVVETFDDGVAILTGITSDGYNSDLLLFKISQDGIPQWADLFHIDGTFQSAAHVEQMSDSSLLTLSYAQAGGWDYGGMLRRISGNGFHECAVDVLPSLVVTQMQAYSVDILLQQTSFPLASAPLYVNDSTSWDSYLSLDSCGIYIPTAIHAMYDVQPSITIHPNPFSFETTIELQREEQGVLRLFSSSGMEVSRVQLQGGRNTLKRGILGNGIYFFEIVTTTNERHTGKVVIE